ncbi:hypothetical protein AB6C73_11625, partial [Vibrio splendidus]
GYYVDYRAEAWLIIVRSPVQIWEGPPNLEKPEQFTLLWLFAFLDLHNSRCIPYKYRIAPHTVPIASL